MGFELLMRRDHVLELELHMVTYDAQTIRDWTCKFDKPYVLNVLYHAWLFADLQYKGEASEDIEVAMFKPSGIFPVQSGTGLATNLRRLNQTVFVKDQVFM